MRDVARFPEDDRRDLFRAASQKMRVHAGFSSASLPRIR
jgi:hypothetical protein